MKVEVGGRRSHYVYSSLAGGPGSWLPDVQLGRLAEHVVLVGVIGCVIVAVVEEVWHGSDQSRGPARLFVCMYECVLAI